MKALRIEASKSRRKSDSQQGLRECRPVALCIAKARCKTGLAVRQTKIV